MGLMRRGMQETILSTCKGGSTVEVILVYKQGVQVVANEVISVI